MLPDDEACLDWLFQHRYPEGVYCPKCKKVAKHCREQKRTSYSPSRSPRPSDAGTIFENSATSLRLWLLAMRISAKQLERELGITYKCAWRIFKRIRVVS